MDDGEDARDSHLGAFGWNDAWAEAFAAVAQPGWRPGRVVLEHGRFLRVQDGTGERLAVAAGRLRHTAGSSAELPTVGDWVAVTDSDRSLLKIQRVLSRQTRLSRSRAGTRGDEQVVAANVDRVLLMMGLDADFNPRRLERYLSLAHAARISPVIVLNKIDLAPDLTGQRAQLVALAPGVPMVATTLTEVDGHAPLLPHLQPGLTLAVLGSSGVGKSTLLNRLVGEERQRTAVVRASDRRGRHTTSHAQLFLLPSGALLVDTPGLREIQLWEAEAGLKDAFADIEALARQCRFHNCRHGPEPGCAIQAALASGALDRARFASFTKLHAELRPSDRRRRR
jgi:ribosome biogenesis GTPase